MKSIVTKLAGKTLLAAILLFTTYAVKAQTDDSHFRIALNGGWAYHIARTSPALDNELKDYANSLRSGLTYGADVMYYIKPSWGVGAKYSRFHKSVSVKGAGNVGGYEKTGKTMSFYGATFGGRINNNSETGALILSLSLGYLGMTEEGVYNAAPYRVTGGTVGSVTEIGYDFKVAEHVAIGAQFSYLGGTLRSVSYEANGMSGTTSYDSGNYESLSRIEFSAGVRFFF